VPCNPKVEGRRKESSMVMRQICADTAHGILVVGDFANGEKKVPIGGNKIPAGARTRFNRPRRQSRRRR
jgi:hypothetical protein